APYGIYKTNNSYIALAMIPIEDLKACLDCTALMDYDQSVAFSKRDEIKAVLAEFLKDQYTDELMKKFTERGIWATELKDWKKLKETAAYEQMDLEQLIEISKQRSIKTSRCPIRIDGEIMWGMSPAPMLGQHTAQIQKEFALEQDH